MRVAVVGSGVAGLVSAHLLDAAHDVTLFEAEDRLGGHTNTVDVEVEGVSHRVDTGFIVYNERTYPAFTRLLRHLDVATRPSDMSFGLSDEPTGLEWRGTSLATLFAQPRNVTNQGFLRMLVDVARFNRLARGVAADDGADPDLTLEDVLGSGRWSRTLVDWYLVPLGSAIWSADPATFTGIPMRTFARFFDNHGLLRLGDQPLWRTVTGGSDRYVDAILRGFRGRVHLAAPVDKVLRRPDDGTVELRTAEGAPESFDHVLLATHSDQALGVLADPTPQEREILGAIRYQSNGATLHTDERLLPRAPRARASWNYHRRAVSGGLPTVTYDLSRLQGIPSSRPLLLTLNDDERIDERMVLERFEYSHPVLDAAAVRAQRRHAELDHRDGVSFAGAYWGHGFHEDGVQSALRACHALGVEVPW